MLNVKFIKQGLDKQVQQFFTANNKKDVIWYDNNIQYDDIQNMFKDHVYTFLRIL